MDGAEIQRYIAKIKGANTHSSKASLFSKLVKSLFGEEANVGLALDVFPELEEHLIAKRGTLAIWGEDDIPEPNLIIEFRTSKLDPLRSEEIIERVKDQLRGYAYVVWRDRKPELPCLLTASDGVHNLVYRPSLKRDLASIDLEGSLQTLAQEGFSEHRSGGEFALRDRQKAQRNHRAGRNQLQGLFQRRPGASLHMAGASHLRKAIRWVRIFFIKGDNGLETKSLPTTLLSGPQPDRKDLERKQTKNFNSLFRNSFQYLLGKLSYARGWISIDQQILTVKFSKDLHLTITNGVRGRDFL
ncbi:hypothetical protein AKJ38_03510 [candidate division MSBL1 archaeon SCGC-AAA259I14]|uniref:Uncharacterized protein n=1 Tax=candidate division MSBL1 archaeon SCGC-AAA259I14 TaxID=1698268 RepID=A0A133UQA9_9EURY|nr:hypothetical protein AKJ38_03510 [candidate division MSBL1 archaeon SCGC-AAA259I14]